MRIDDLLLEEPADPAEIKQMKTSLLGQLRQLPEDDKTRKALIEIEEILQSVNAGGRMARLQDELRQIQDPAVTGFQQDLAMFVLTADADPKEKRQLLDYWKAGTIVDIDKLLSKNKHSFAEIFRDYETNNAIKLLVDRVMSISALGQGKGEFGLNVLSKHIAKPAEDKAVDAAEDEEDEEGNKKKGDLLIYYGDSWKKIECKTTHGGSARFGDQKVTPNMATFAPAAQELNDFIADNKAIYKQVTGKSVLPDAGLALSIAIDIYKILPPAKKATFLTKVENCVKAIFFGKHMKKAVAGIMSAVKSGNANEAKEIWGQANFNYYLSQKDDYGVLNTNLNSKDFVFYNSTDDLRKEGLRFHIATPYLSSLKDPNRTVYPQVEVIPSTFGAEYATGQLKKPEFKKRAWGSTTLETRIKLVQPIITELCRIRGITDKRTIANMVSYATGLVDDQRSNPDRSFFMQSLETKFPQLRVAKAAQLKQKAKKEATVSPETAVVSNTAPEVATTTPKGRAPRRITPALEEAIEQVDSLIIKYF